MFRVILIIFFILFHGVNAFAFPPTPPATGATINDSAGNGDTTEAWSADKIYDQLALKLGGVSLSDCSGITSGVCLDTDDGVVYVWNGAAVVTLVEALTSPTFTSVSVGGTAITDGDATPSATGASFLYTANTGATTITDFDGTLNDGQNLWVFVNDANTTFDFTSSGLEGSTEDITAATGQSYLFIYSTVDSQWHLARGTISPDDLLGDNTDDGLIDQDIIEGFGASATPAITMQDSDDEPGTASINANSSGGDNPVVMSIGVEEDDSESVVYIELDGTNEDVEIKKVLVPEGGVKSVGIYEGDPDSWTIATKYYYGGIVIANASGECTLAGIASGMQYTIKADDGVSAIYNPNAADTIIRNGVSLAQGEALITSASAGICYLEYRSANTIEADCDSNMTEETPE
jgi:hypothetical protein